ncbi:MAG: GTPase Era [Anaerolineales bacterium]|nr:GTPase Era [Anaerolineales bacterium]
MDPIPSDFKSGFVAVMGRPNVGKSTLINRLLGTKIAATSPWPQTTRKTQMGILSLDDAQIIFVDTPGFHQPKNKLGEKMVQEALRTIEECDLCIFLVDISQEPEEEDRLLAQSLSGARRLLSIILAMNKADVNSSELNEDHRELYREFIPSVDEILISATNGDNLDELTRVISSHLPAGPAFFPEDQLTDLYERDIAADLIREALLFNLRAEVPHSIAVRIDEFKDRDENTSYIAATLFVERDSQKGIVIGQGGEKLKQIGIDARQKIEEMTGRKVYLELRVKVRKNWRNDETALSLFGYKS